MYLDGSPSLPASIVAIAMKGGGDGSVVILSEECRKVLSIKLF